MNVFHSSIQVRKKCYQATDANNRLKSTGVKRNCIKCQIRYVTDEKFMHISTKVAAWFIT